MKDDGVSWVVRELGEGCCMLWKTTRVSWVDGELGESSCVLWKTTRVGWVDVMHSVQKVPGYF